jgi:exonuclease III
MDIPDSYLINDYCRSAGLRKPLTGLFRSGGFDFWMVGVHLKSGYGNNISCTNNVRNLQVHYISKQLWKLKNEDPDILLIGDFNARSNHESIAEFKDNGFIALTDKNKRNPASNTRTQGSGKRGDIIDLLMIQPANTSEWIAGSTLLYKPEKPDEFSRRLSDHVPVWADFITTRDDD